MALIRPQPYPVGTTIEIRVPRGVPVTVVSPKGTRSEFTAPIDPSAPRKSARAEITLATAGTWTWSWPQGDGTAVRTAEAITVAQPAPAAPAPEPVAVSPRQYTGNHGVRDR
jgi:hypothetical protein